jgi:tRNA/tmRNA/rRNA uracil-C5-methylase (TrmA/RlmC/RlmD family)
MDSNRDELLELQTTTVAHGGVSVARLDGRVVFVADAVPGERVLARITDDAKASFWRADTVEVLEASPDRVEHVWAAASLDRDPADRAGGAEFGHIALPRQRALKAEVLTDALRRFGGIDRAVEVEPIGADAQPDDGAPDTRTRTDTARAAGTRWRTRLRLHVGADGRLGPYAARSHRVIPVDDLPLATAAIEAEADLGGRVHGAAALEYVETSDGEVRVRRITGELSKTGGARGRAGGAERGGGRRGGARAGRRSGGGRASATPSAPTDDDVLLGGGLSAGAGGGAEKPATIIERVGEREFRLAENGFWQVHTDAARTLSSAVADLASPELVDPRAANLDLYGGVGLLAAALGDRFGQALRITSVESDAVATDHASENLAEWVGAQAVTARVDRYLADLERTAGADERRRLSAATVVIDPPRTGAGRVVVESLARLGVAQVVYVACDPVAFARDAGTLRELGYGLRALRAYDLFPHTHHVETVGVFARDDAARS